MDDDGTLTLEWPRFHPLIEHAPVELPEDWRLLAKSDQFIVLFAGYALGMWEHAADGEGHPLGRLEHAAEMGTLASGVVPLLTTPAPPQHL